LDVEELKQFEARHLIGTKARLAMALLLYLGPRRQDVVRLGKQHIRSEVAPIRAEEDRPSARRRDR
jgi:hypothetical protein